MLELFISAFFLGMIANLHCVGMCGPIALALPLNRSSKLEIVIGVLQYNFGRIFTYSILGFIVGLFGLGINLIGILQGLSVAAGIGIILYAWRKQLFSGSFFRYFSSSFIQRFSSKNMGKILRGNSPFKLFLFGMLNGILPCGMVYTALIAALVADTPINASFILFFFGLGTLPGMIIITLFANQITTQFRGEINKILPYLVTIIGLLILLRGLNLDIPYLSPKASYNSATKELNMESCHSPIKSK